MGVRVRGKVVVVGGRLHPHPPIHTPRADYSFKDAPPKMEMYSNTSCTPFPIPNQYLSCSRHNTLVGRTAGNWGSRPARRIRYRNELVACMYSTYYITTQLLLGSQKGRPRHADPRLKKWRPNHDVSTLANRRTTFADVCTAVGTTSTG